MTSLIYNDPAKVYDLMKDLNSWDYIDTLNLTTKDIENTYCNMNLSVTGKARDTYVENDIKLPPMATYFYYFVYVYKAVPTQDQYIRFYYALNEEWICTYIGEKYDAALKGRLSRFYPSIARDFHFYHLVRECGKFPKVLFNLKYDLEGKVDVFVRSNTQWYGIQLRTQTKNSNHFYEKKKYRNPLPVKATLIDLPINLSYAKSIRTKGNDFKVYNQHYISLMINEIIKNENITKVS